MVIRKLRALGALGLVAALACTAHADSGKLEQARQALEAVRYDDAQHLLVAAIAEGTSTPAMLREIYKLSASTAVVLGQADAGEQYYRRWLALDPTAALGADVSPKLRAPFDAAKAYIAAHGRFEVTASRISVRELELAVLSDPLAMARGVKLEGGGTVPFSAERRVRLTTENAGTVHAIVVDEYGNGLTELDVAAPVITVIPPVPDPLPPAANHPPPDPGRPAHLHTAALYGWGLPCLLFLGTGTAFTVAAFYEHAQVGDILDDSKNHTYADLNDRRHLRNTFTALGATFVGVGALLLIPTGIYLSKRTHGRAAERTVTPFVGGGAAGLTLSGGF